MGAPRPYGVYTETALLGAVMDEDWAEAVRLREDMLPGERSTFARQLNEALDLVHFGEESRTVQHALHPNEHTKPPKAATR